MPRCLDSLEITLDTPVPPYLHGRLDRMSTDSLWVVGYDGPHPPIRGISLHEVRTLTSTAGGRIEGQDLRDEAAGMLHSPPISPPPKKVPPEEVPPTRPPPSTLILRRDAWTEFALPADSIAYVQSMDSPSCNRWGFMVVGMIVDALLVVGCFDAGLLSDES